MGQCSLYHSREFLPRGNALFQGTDVKDMDKIAGVKLEHKNKACVIILFILCGEYSHTASSQSICHPCLDDTATTKYLCSNSVDRSHPRYG